MHSRSFLSSLSSLATLGSLDPRRPAGARRLGAVIRTAGVLGLLAALGASSVASAAIYRYQGNAFDRFTDTPAIPGSYTSADRVEGTFELASELAPNLDGDVITGDVLGFDFSDGRQAFDETTPLGQTVFQVSTDGLGDIVAWQIILSTSPSGSRNTIRTVNFGSETRDRGEQFLLFGVVDSGTRIFTPGTWTIVPEPGTGLLLGMGLALAAVRRERRTGSSAR